MQETFQLLYLIIVVFNLVAPSCYIGKHLFIFFYSVAIISQKTYSWIIKSKMKQNVQVPASEGWKHQWVPDHHSTIYQMPPQWELKWWQFSLQPSFWPPKPSFPPVLPTRLIWLFSNPMLSPILFKEVPPVSHTPPKCHLCGFFQTTNAKLLDSSLFTCFGAALTGPTAWNTAIKLTTQPIKVWPAAVS